MLRMEVNSEKGEDDEAVGMHIKERQGASSAGDRGKMHLLRQQIWLLEGFSFATVRKSIG